MSWSICGLTLSPSNVLREEKCFQRGALDRFLGALEVMDLRSLQQVIFKSSRVAPIAHSHAILGKGQELKTHIQDQRYEMGTRS